VLAEQVDEEAGYRESSALAGLGRPDSDVAVDLGEGFGHLDGPSE